MTLLVSSTSYKTDVLLRCEAKWLVLNMELLHFYYTQPLTCPELDRIEDTQAHMTCQERHLAPEQDTPGEC